jgi:aminobenzoyl-glutamate transport protein
MQRLLDFIERAGNRVPHPVLMFLYLIAFIVVLSHILYLADVQVTEQIAVPVAEAVVPDYYEDTYAPGYRDAGSSYSVDYVIEERTIAVQSLLTTEGIRFMFSSFVSNFQGFGVVAVAFIAILGAGVAEAAGLMSALIRLLVQVAPARLITYIIVLVGVLSSIATDAGYLILIPLGATAFLSLKRHPLAGMAAAFAGVSAAFGVNFLITPVDSMLTEITNEAISLSGGEPISIMANFFFSFGSTILLTIVAGLITERIIEPRLGEYVPADDIEQPDPEEGLSADERKGMWYALFAFLALAAFFALITVPEGAALRDPVTGAIIGPTPFMDSLLLIITLSFLVAGIGYGIGAKTIHSSDDVINAVTKTFAGLSGLVFMLLIIAQFIAYFNFTQMPTVAAIAMADALEAAGLGALPLLIGLILVITVLNIIIPGVVPKWAIFAPVFIPIFIRLGVAPQTVLAAYRVGDSPLNVITPLMVYLPFVVVVAQRYVKNTGLGTVVSLMLPYSLIMLVVWILFFALWFLLGVPLGPGYPVGA